jgi:hypothetical protein
MGGVFVRRVFLVLLVISMVFAAAGCNEGELAKTAEQIAREQGTDKAAVLDTLKAVGGSDKSEELTLARTWKAKLPTSTLPDFSEQIRTFAEEHDLVYDSLKGAACDSVWQAIQTGHIPSLQELTQEFTSDAALAAVPGADVVSYAADVEDSYNDILAGAPAYARVRLMMLKWQYC